MANSPTIQAQKFQAGDRVLEDLNPDDTPQAQRRTILITHGTIIDYRAHPGDNSVLVPFVQWDNNQQGYSDDSRLQRSDKADPRAATTPPTIDIEAIAVSPGLERLDVLNNEIQAGFAKAAAGLRQVQEAAREIKEDRLWEEFGSASFEDYCFEAFGWKKSNAYSMAQAGETYRLLKDSGVPETEIPESTSALNELSKAGAPEKQAAILAETKTREGSVTAAGIKKTLKHTPSVQLMIALWAQIAAVERPAIATHPERMIVSGDLFEVPITFETVKEAQAHWSIEGQKLCAIAVSKGVIPSSEAKKTLMSVPCKITSTARSESADQHAEIMGDWSEGATDPRGNRPTPWDYPVRVSSSPYLQAFRLFQLRIVWEDTADWQPSALAPAPSLPATAKAAENYQPRETSPLYKPDDSRGQQKAEIARGLATMAPFPSGQYSIIAADPAWQYSLREKDASHRGRTPYPTMSDEEILTLPVGELAADNAYLLLWATNNHLPLAFDCLAVWGFDYKMIHTWNKISNNTGTYQIGVGHYGRGATEHYLVATKGSPGSFTTHGLTNIPTGFMASKSEHSRKPDIFWETANALRSALGGPAIELFARSRREGWDAWGLESEG